MAGHIQGYRRVILILVLLLPLLATLALTTPVLAAPVIILSPTSGAAGTNILVEGKNFNSYVGDYITVTFGASEIPGSPLIIPETGNFSVQFTVPEGTMPGQYWVSVYTVTPVSLLARHAFDVTPLAIALDKTQGPVDTEVMIIGQGFYSDRIVDFYYYNITAEKIGDTRTDATGNFSLSFIVPHSIAGQHAIIARNDKGNEIQTIFLVTPQIYSSINSAGPGKLVTLTGTGFGYRTDVEIHLGARPITTVRTSDRGDFEVVFNVPDVIPRTYDLTAEDVYENESSVPFTVGATVSIDQISGSIGSEVTLTGDGFVAGTEITITFNDTTVLTIEADVFGEFTAAFTVPRSSGGYHQITVTDGAFVETFNYFVESEKPPPPSLLLPYNQTETRSLVYFDWQDVTDPSPPVTYQLQVSDDRNFSSMLLNISDIEISEYTLTESQALPATQSNMPYYWRVKATDGAGNQSEWTEPWSFNINLPDIPVLLTPDIDSSLTAPAFFDWQDISSFNPPVTYNLQIGTDLGFSSIILERIGLTASEYILSEEDKLPKAPQDTPYYWRIKAIDNTQNEGEWSVPWSFYYQTGFTFPSWATYTLIGIAVVLVGYLAFWLGRRGITRSSE
jgi:hypothetical protein